MVRDFFLVVTVSGRVVETLGNKVAVVFETTDGDSTGDGVRVDKSSGLAVSVDILDGLQDPSKITVKLMISQAVLK